MRKILVILFGFIIAYLALPACCQAQGWSYDWNLRVDRHGMAAGIFENTPFPIDQNTQSYSIKNDEYPDGKVFYLGAKYYVDGGYTLQNGASDGSWDRPWTSIPQALKQVGPGNNTILVRGAHNRWGNNFNGIYSGTYSLSDKAGVDDTHRWMLAGYSQERPVLDAGGSGYIISRNNETLRDSFITVQRLKLQNTINSGIRLGWDVAGDKRANYFYAIDVHFFQCGYSATDPASLATDGSVYYLNVDHGWIFHCTSEYSYGHGFKMGDGTSDHTIEWSVARFIGYWQGIYNQHVHSPVAFDFPTDEGADIQQRDPKNLTCRYNIAYSIHNYALQIRGGKNFSVHHNEFYDVIHHDEVPPNGRGTMGKITVLLYSGQVAGDFYANIIRNPGNPGSTGILITGINGASSPVRIYNNLIFGLEASSIRVGMDNVQPVKIFNNSIYGLGSAAFDDKAGPLISTQSNTVIKNNILFQAGKNAVLRTCVWVSGCSTDRSHNLYYAPLGSIGVSLAAGEIIADPAWRSLPTSPFNISNANLTMNSAAVDAGTDLGQEGLMGGSFVGVSRAQGKGWDMGAYEYNPNIHLADVSGDGLVTLYDAYLVLRYTLGGVLSDDQSSKADINEDGVINDTDKNQVVKQAMGK